MSEASSAADEPRPPSASLWLRLDRVFHQVERAATEQLRDFGLSVAQFDVLAHVGEAEGMTQQELANALVVTKGNVCQLLQRLEGCGLIERRQEGRANRLFLTARGRDIYDRAVPAYRKLIAAEFSSLGAEQQAELLDLLRHIDRGTTQSRD